MYRVFLFATVLAVLLGMSSATICETYSQTTTNATAQAALIQAIVVRAAVGGTFTPPSGSAVTIQGLFSSTGPLYQLFTGGVQYRSGAPNYVSAGTSQTQLVGKLVAYFGAVFGCNAPNYPAVSNTNMYAVHQNMYITQAQETYFNTQLANTLTSFGVSAADITTAGNVLGWFNRCGAPAGGNLGSGTAGLLQICGSNDCSIATNSNYATCIQYYGYPGSSSSSSGGYNGPNPATLPTAASPYVSSSTGNGASGTYAAGGLFVALMAIAASLLL